MRHLTIKWFLACSSISLLLFSCSKKLDEVYQNPNATVRVPIETLLPSCIGNFLGSSSAAGSGYGMGGDAVLIGRYIQYWGSYSTSASPISYSASNQSNYDAMGGTIAASDNLGSMWAAHYYGMGQNLNRIIEWGTEEQKWDYVGAASAMRAWSLLENTNEYGEMILRQAFNPSLQTFLYDEQPEVYDSVRATCYRALEYLNRTDGAVSQANFAKGDAYFNKGDVNKWKKFTYGILARSYQYISNKTALYKADSAIKYADLAMSANADNAVLSFANTGITGTSNYFGPIRVNIGSIRQTNYIVGMMNGTDSTFLGAQDPRRWYILRENPNGNFTGIIVNKGTQGLLAADQPQNFWGARYDSTAAPAVERGRYIYRNGADFPIMTASEMKFIKAEAAYLKGDKEIARIAYREGIDLSFDMLSTAYATNVPSDKVITASSKSTYLSNPVVVPASGAGLTLSQIMLQKYIALYGWGVQETWVDMRRYHYNADRDPSGTKAVYASFVPPTGTDLYANNNGNLVYRARPRYNSEYLYNIPELRRIGALSLDYHTKQPWFATR